MPTQVCAMTALNWNKLLNATRLRLNDVGEPVCYHHPEEAPRTPAEADIQRIVFSVPFRRLAGKTQVHPLAKVDYVHNRLTHSLEVAETGAGLAQRVTARLALSPEQITAATLHVKAACLGHDIGNPPYGHAGEYAIQAWVETHLDALGALLAQDSSAINAPSPERILEDFRKFDGNAQTFRLLSSSTPADGAYFRLTCASLGALIKYPRTAAETNTVKFSCFQTSRPHFDCVMQALGLQESKSITRHPLSYLTEIADDICYCVTDCEDAVLMGILDERLVREWYLQLLENPTSLKVKDVPPVAFLRARVIGDLMHCFTEELAKAFLSPESLATFEKTSPTWQRLQTLKRNYKVVFDDAAKVRKELNAQAHFHRVLDTFFAVTRNIKYERPTYSDSLLRKYTFGEAFIAQHQSKSYAWWLHTMFDFIIGMTDAYLHRFSEGLH